MRKDLDAQDLGLCVCGARIYANVEEGAVVHEEPVCKLFLELDPDQFLTYVRRSRGIPDNAL